MTAMDYNNALHELSKAEPPSHKTRMEICEWLTETYVKVGFLKDEDEVHWKTRRALLADLAAIQAVVLKMTEQADAGTLGEWDNGYRAAVGEIRNAVIGRHSERDVVQAQR